AVLEVFHIPLVLIRACDKKLERTFGLSGGLYGEFMSTIRPNPPNDPAQRFIIPNVMLTACLFSTALPLEYPIKVPVGHYNDLAPRLESAVDKFFGPLAVYNDDIG